MAYISTKFFKEIGPVAYRQWKADSHCKYIHGYALSFYFEFQSETLDARNWVVDFGGLKGLKHILEEWFDHTLLVSEDDPELQAFMDLEVYGLAQIRVVERTGCEGIADFLYRYINLYFLKEHGYSKDVWCTKVQVSEKEANSAMRIGVRGDISGEV